MEFNIYKQQEAHVKNLVLKRIDVLRDDKTSTFQDGLECAVISNYIADWFRYSTSIDKLLASQKYVKDEIQELLEKHDFLEVLEYAERIKDEN